MEARPRLLRGAARGGRFLRGLRRWHAWIGLAGAGLGLLFGFTGFLMNHRAVLRIDAGQIAEQRVSVELPEPLPGSPEALASELAKRFQVPSDRVKTRIQRARTGRLGAAEVRAAEQWVVLFQGHRRFAQAAYTPGNRTVEVEQREASPLQVLKRLHKNEGGSLGWTLLVDAFAGAMGFMTLSGVLLWTHLRGRRLLAAGLVLGGIGAAVTTAALGW